MTLQKQRKKTPHSDDPYYDITDPGDLGLLLASLRAEYGVTREEAAGMSWAEFCDLASGIGPDTPLGRIVGIRAEKDADTLKRMSEPSRKIHDDWAKKRAKSRSAQENSAFLESMRQGFIAMAGGTGDGK